MMKNVQELINAKNKEVAELEKVEKELEKQRSEKEHSIQEVEQKEKEVKQRLEKLEEENNGISTDAVYKQWLENRDQLIDEQINPVIEEIKSNKQAYLKAVAKFNQEVHQLESERGQLMRLLESNGASAVELSPFNVNRYRSPADAKNLLIDKNNIELQEFNFIING